MIQAHIGWCWNEHYIYQLESGAALLLSSPSYGGDGGWRYFDTAEEALRAAGMGDGQFVRDKGDLDFDDTFIEQVRFAPEGRFVPEVGHPYHLQSGYPDQEAHLATMLPQM